MELRKSFARIFQVSGNVVVSQGGHLLAKESWRVKCGSEEDEDGSVSKPCTPGEHQNSW